MGCGGLYRKDVLQTHQDDQMWYMYSLVANTASKDDYFGTKPESSDVSCLVQLNLAGGEQQGLIHASEAPTPVMVSRVAATPPSITLSSTIVRRLPPEMQVILPPPSLRQVEFPNCKRAVMGLRQSGVHGVCKR